MCAVNEIVWNVIPIKVKVLFTLEQITKAQKCSTGIVPLFFNLGAKWGGWVVNAKPRPLYPQGSSDTHCTEG